MLVLCSNGLSSPALRDAVAAQMRQARTAALVINADRIYRAHNYHVPRCLEELHTLGLDADILDLDEQPAKALLRYDAVEFIGGNPYELLETLRACDAQDVLRRIAEERVLIGWSAAAFVFSPTLALVDRYSAGMNTPGLTDLTALHLTDTEVLPHYSRFLARFDRFEETCRDYEASRPAPVIRLNDGDGVIIRQGTSTVIRA